MAPQTEGNRKRVIDAYAFTTEATKGIEEQLPRDRRAPFLRLIDKALWRVRRNLWKYAAILFLVLSAQLLFLQTYLQLGYIAERERYRTTLIKALGDLDSTIASLQQTDPQVGEKLTKIRDQLKASASAF